MQRHFALIALGALVWTPAAEAAKVRTWQHNSLGAHDKAQLHAAVVSSEGAIRLSRELRPWAALDATRVWDLVQTGDGTVYAATGDEGKLFRVTPDGKASVAYTAEDSQVLCLAVGGDGAVYAGTGPSGTIVRVADGKAAVWYETGDKYVWSLAVDPRSGDLYAGTGPKGRVHRIGEGGKGEVVFTSKQEHVLCVATAPDGTLYAGTDKGGLVYRVGPKGKAFVLFQAPQPEVRRIVVTPEALYVGTSAPTGKHRGGASVSGLALPAWRADRLLAALPALTGDTLTDAPEGGKEPGEGKEKEKGKEIEKEKEPKGKPSAAPSTPGSGDNSVYRITPDGGVREVFREKALILSLMRQGGRLLVGTGTEGQLFEADEASREKTELARLDHGQVLSLLRRVDGSVVLGTGDPGKLYVLEDHFAARGTVLSEVLDAKMLSKWGSLTWQADTPAGTSLTVAVRSGNVDEPDDTWSDWSAEQSDPEKATVTAPPARFLQYRLTLKSADGKQTPSLRTITVRYATTNLAPEVTKVEVPDLSAATLENPKKLKIKWTAQDPNEDELTFAVYVRKEGWKNWVLLEDDLDRTDYEWDTTTTPSGVYAVKVVASDRRDNDEADALTGERVSAPVIVCHTPPAVTVRVSALEGDQALVEATATSPLVRLTSASFAVNGKKWVNVFPTDGLFDAKEEHFRFRTEGLKPGTYVLVLKVKDAAGNVGSADVVFTVQARPLR